MLKLVIHNRSNSVRAKTLTEAFGSQWYTDNSFTVVDAEMIPKHPSRGILESFKKCIRIAQEAGESEVIIFEDDIRFLRNDSLHDFLDYRDLIPDTYDLYLGGIYSGNILPINNHVAEVPAEFCGLHCCMVNGKFYDKFLSIETDKNVDYVISTRSLFPCEVYCAYPMLAIQHDGYSDNVKQETNYNSALFEQYKLKV